jgi:heterotetrameric sarcosine oxidase gamma subunit
VAEVSSAAATAGAPLAGAPLARSPISPAPPVAIIAGWEVSARRASGDLTITDCAPLTKVQVRGPLDASLHGIPFGRAARTASGTLVAGSGPGEWLLLAPQGTPPGDLPGDLRDALQAAPAALVTAVDLTHGRALVRLTGAAAPDVLALVCGINLADDVMPDGSAFRTAVAGVATDIIRDDWDGARSYLLHCERSSGQYLFDCLLRAGADHGIEIAGFAASGGAEP